MERILLPKGEWFYEPDDQIGQKGGFGSVNAGRSAEHGDLAIKKLHLSADQAAHREIGIARELAGRNLTHVMPVFDAGEDPDSGAYFLIMPRADNSLHDQLNTGRTFSAMEAARVLLQIASGLLEVHDIVHRDLKPANILFHEGKWKIADFGIARFIEEATSLQTLKGCLTMQYAAPEQWEYIRATQATDVYALGSIGYALLTGSPPFQGTSEELRDKHLHSDPPPLSPTLPPQLRSLLTMMLRKPPAARPNLDRIKKILTDIEQEVGPPNPGFRQLAEAAAEVARQKAEAERQEKQLSTLTQARLRLAQKAAKTLRAIVSRLFESIQVKAPVANRRSPYSLSLGQGMLQASVAPEVSDIDPGSLDVGAFANSKWDIVRAETISVQQKQPPYKWSSSLWYCKLPNTTDYRWYEASYFSAHRAEAFAPYDLTTKIHDADLAAAPIMHVYQLAFGPQSIDDEDENRFSERWAALLALAAEGKLAHPSSLPLRDQFWR